MMLSVIIVTIDKPAVYRVDPTLTADALIQHWIHDTDQDIGHDCVRLVSVTGDALPPDSHVVDIPVGSLGTRVVRAFSNDRITVRVPSTSRCVSRELSVPVFLSCTGQRCVIEVAHMAEMEADEFRLRLPSGVVLDAEKSLVAQEVTPGAVLGMELAHVGVVRCRSRVRRWERRVCFFPEMAVDTMLEKGVAVEKQRLSQHGKVVPVKSGRSLQESGLCEAGVQLELTLELCEPVVVETKDSERMVWVWPEERLSSLFSRVEDYRPPPPEPAVPTEDDEETERLRQHDPLLYVDVLYPERKLTWLEEKSSPDPVTNHDNKSLYYRGRQLDVTSTFAESRLPPYALVTVNPMQVVIDKRLEFRFDAHIPYNASVGDVAQLLPELRSELYAENFELTAGKHGGLLFPLNAAVTRWGISDGKTICVRHVVLNG